MGEIIANPFPKFFNLGERMQLSDLPNEIPVITEKLDGFLGILYPDGDTPAITTRGSFDSPMAIWATRWINERYTMSDFKKGYTYLFEIIDPALRREQGLIVDYGNRSECVLLAVRDTATGAEINHIDEATRLGLSYARELNGTLEDALAALPSLRGTEMEGFVCKYSNGLRIKLKGEEYVRLHKTISGMSTKRIHQIMIEFGAEGIENIIQGIPDEHYKHIHDVIDEILHKQQDILNNGILLYERVKDMPSRREQAEIVRQSPYASVVFAMLDGKDYRKIAMKQAVPDIQG